jgi:small subunit ribosomal protein S13
MIELEFFKKLRYEGMRLDKVLGSIYGLGRIRVNNICKTLGLKGKTNFREVPDVIRKDIVRHINARFTVDIDLKQNIYLVKQKLVDLKTHRGIRMSLGLPVNGQRTKTNARTAKRLNKRW